MFFPNHDIESSSPGIQKRIYINLINSNSKAIQIKTTHKKLSFNQIKKILNCTNLRLFNTEGAQYFEDDLQYVKNKTVLYATRGQQFDSGICFDEYELGQKLGEGGFGNVFLATHRPTGNKFAIKIIKTQNIGSVSDIDNIFVEAEILKTLNHENIIKVYNCLTLKNMEVAIIMQFLKGGQLLKYVQKEGRLDEKTSQIFFRQIVKGMKYCHQNNLIHRDLKLQNILLVNCQQQKIKIIDFGIAGAISFLTQQDLDIGSLCYMAPECFTNSKDYKVDGRIDVWASGVILYCMLHGTLPFKGNNNYQTIQMIKSGKFKLDPSLEKILTEACIDVLRQCLQVNPKKRISMDQLNDHLWINRNMFAGKIEDQPLKVYPIIVQQVGKQKVLKIKIPAKMAYNNSPISSKIQIKHKK